MPKINVKCGSKMLKVDVDLDDSPMLLKAQLFELTEIPPERQKLLIKGKTIGDESWTGVTIKDGSTIMLVGGTASADVHSQSENKDGSGSPVKPIKNDEIILPVGLKNLGNTCYMNATLQCFKIIPELDAAIKKYSVILNMNPPGDAMQRSRMMTSMLKKLYEEMDQKRLLNANASESSDSTQSALPLLFLHVLHQTFPQFATQDERGHYQQQDANECFCEVLRLLTEEVKYMPPNNLNLIGAKVDVIPLRKFFEIGFQVTTNCKEEGGENENSDEQSQKSEETHFQLNCYLTQEVRYIHSGIKSKMNEEIEKQSVALGRNAIYEKHSLISRLPAYLSVQIVRFFYKDKENINAKILKDVKFPITFDIFDMCTPELQEKLKPARQAIKDYDDMKMELQRKAKLAEEGEKNIDIKPKGFYPNAFPDDLGSNNSGIYELKALITHKGRASNHGHYVAWVRVVDDDDFVGNKQQSAKWAACDDEDVYPVTEEEILKLSGGGDWHCAYVLLYGPKKIPQFDMV